MVYTVEDRIEVNAYGADLFISDGCTGGSGLLRECYISGYIVAMI